MRHTTKLLPLFSLFATACLIAGCEPPPPSPQELGRIVFNESEVPGANETYELPERIRNAQPAEEPPRRMPGE
jgi:hypothetical protein